MSHRAVFAFFYFVFEGNFQVKAHGGLFSKGQFNEGFFCVTSLGGLYFKGLVQGRLYFRNFSYINA